jgi:hypothetical protein
MNLQEYLFLFLLFSKQSKMKKRTVFILLVLGIMVNGFAQFRMTRADSLRRDSINKATQTDYHQMLSQLNITSTRRGLPVIRRHPMLRTKMKQKPRPIPACPIPWC